VYDATGKIPSGLLNGHVNNYGDFDMCLEAMTGDETNDEKGFESQYCLAEIQITVNAQHNYLNFLRALMLSFETYQSTFKDVRIRNFAM
jgi:hypothetical protein